MNPKTHVFADAAGAAEACGTRVIELLEEALAAREFATFAVSGGHTPLLLFQRMASRPFDWKRLHLFWVDERCVPPADSASNYKLAKRGLIEPVHIPEHNVRRIIGEMAPQQAAEHYAGEISRFFGLAAEEMPVFDVVQCGMGPDAHTGSLFPGEPLIDDRRELPPQFLPHSSTNGG
jgi:6-phosphogluconolactonase